MKKVILHYEYSNCNRIRKLIIIKIDLEVPLFPFGKPKSKRNGSIVLQLEAADLRAAASCAVRNLSRAIRQKSSDSSNLSQFIGDVSSDIKNILELVDDIAQVTLFNILSVLEISNFLSAKFVFEAVSRTIDTGWKGRFITISFYGFQLNISIDSLSAYPNNSSLIEN